MSNTETTVIGTFQEHLERSIAAPLPRGKELEEVPFGEYLIARGAITRDQLYAAMRLQDENPGVRLGECIASLEILPWPQVDRLYIDYASCAVVFR